MKPKTKIILYHSLFCILHLLGFVIHPAFLILTGSIHHCIMDDYNPNKKENAEKHRIFMEKKGFVKSENGGYIKKK